MIADVRANEIANLNMLEHRKPFTSFTEVGCEQKTMCNLSVMCSSANQEALEPLGILLLFT